MGKTDYLLILASLLYRIFGRTTVWIRHKLKELTDDGNYKSFLNDPHAYGWMPDEWTAKADGVYTAENGGEKVIEFASLSTFSNSRGGGHPDVLLMVIDELVPEDGKFKPSPALCVKGLLSLCETFTRGRAGACMFAMSNYVFLGNPYFAKFRIYPNRKYEITVFRDKGIDIQIPRGYKIANPTESKLSKLRRAGGGETYSNSDNDKMWDLIRPAPKGAKPLPYIVKADEQYYREFVHKGRSYWMEWNSTIPEHMLLMCGGVDDLDENCQILPPVFYRDQCKAI